MFESGSQRGKGMQSRHEPPDTQNGDVSVSSGDHFAGLMAALHPLPLSARGLSLALRSLTISPGKDRI